jgi:DeoR/GlpR family transcriptional regulator of sugar metabolism
MRAACARTLQKASGLRIRREVHGMSTHQDEILKLLKNNVAVPVGTIAKRLFISESTLRRHLGALAREGLVIRTHGGAMLRSDAPDKIIPYYLRNLSETKKSVARQAAGLIKNGSVIMLDASTSAFCIVPHLAAAKDIIVITSGIKTAVTLCELSIRTYQTGGEIVTESFSCFGQDAIGMVKHYNADIMFFSCSHLSDDGFLTDDSQHENHLRAEMLRQAKTKVLLIDSSKLHKKSFHNLCTLRDIDYCFCDAELPPHLKAMLATPHA